jgi:hypothetical protein
MGPCLDAAGSYRGAPGHRRWSALGQSGISPLTRRLHRACRRVRFARMVRANDQATVSSRNLAPAAPSPTPAAAAATSAAAASAATPTATTATTATADPSYLLQASGPLLPIEQMERGETDVGHLLFAENEAVFGPVVVGLRDIGGRQSRCGCAPRQRKPQSDGTQGRHGSGFGRAVLSRSLLPPCHGRFLRYVVRFNLT